MFEQFVYETRPFAYLATALAAQLNATNTLTTLSSWLLAGCMVLVLYWRYENRRQRSISPSRVKPARK